MNANKTYEIDYEIVSPRGRFFRTEIISAESPEMAIEIFVEWVDEGPLQNLSGKIELDSVHERH